MELRALGKTGLCVSPIGLGCVRIGRNAGLKHPGPQRALPSDDEVLALLRCASEQGVNLLDTAPAYGSSEERIGNILSKANWFGGSGTSGRDAWVVCTKVGEEFDNSAGVSRFDFSPEATRASVERSIRRLRVEALDVVLVHSDGRDEWIIASSGCLDMLHQLKRLGMIRAVGMSTKTVEGGLLALRDRAGIGGSCDVVMVEYNPRSRSQGVVIDAARLRGSGVLVKKALGSGHLQALAPLLPGAGQAGVASSPSKGAGATWGAEGVEQADPAADLIRFAARREGVSSVVIGTTNALHLEDACASVSA